MNKIIILIMGIFVMTGLVYALANITITGSHLRVSSLQKGLVGHWALDGESLNNVTNRTTDKTPYENHGTNYGATLTTDQMGQSNRAMSFDGVGNYVQVESSESLKPEILTVSFWIQIHGTPAERYIFCTKWYGWSVEIESARRLYFRIYGGGDSPKSSPLTVGIWYHMVGVYDPSVGAEYQGNTLYINGERVGTTPNSNAIVHSDNVFTIGKYVSGYHLDGLMNEVRIYNRALSADEIDTLYHSYRPKLSAGSLQKGLVLDMPLTSTYLKDETAGSEVMTDRTPYSNDGQNYGATVGNDYTSFDGNDYIDLPNDLGYSSQFSAFAWFKQFGSPPGNYHIIFGGQQLEISIPVAGQIRTGVYTNARYVSNHGSGLTDGEWHYVGFTFNGTKKESYIDGDYVGGMNVLGNLTSSFSYRRIGRYGSSTMYYANGSISNIRIYNRVLSESEIKLLYDKGR